MKYLQVPHYCKKSSRFFWLTVLVTLLLALLTTSFALAQDNPPITPSDDQVNAIAKQLYCPVCENVPLDVCPTQACAQWRQLIREKITQGWSADQIKNYFVQQYGDRVLATPPIHGLNYLVYIIPPLAIIAGVFILFRAMQAWKKPLPADSAQEIPSEASKDEYVIRFEEELRRH